MKITNISVLCTNPIKHKEGLSNAILESLAFGVPVIATNDGGTPEILIPGVNGYLIPAFDSKKLSVRILMILNDNAKRELLSVNARNTVLRNFSLESMTNNYIKLYSNLFKQPN